MTGFFSFSPRDLHFSHALPISSLVGGCLGSAGGVVGSAIKKSHAVPVPILKAYRLGNVYTCGLCRSTYGSRDEAQTCLGACLREYLSLEPIVNLKERDEHLYQCRLCRRKYPALLSAEDCSSDCRQKLQRRLAAENQVAAFAPLPAAQGRPERNRVPAFLLADASIQKPKLPFQAKAGGDGSGGTDAAGGGGSNDAALAILADEPKKDAPTQAPEEPQYKKKGVSRDEDKFHREGAKYLCNECQKDYFTRVEVIKCYNAHFAD